MPPNKGLQATALRAAPEAEGVRPSGVVLGWIGPRCATSGVATHRGTPSYRDCLLRDMIQDGIDASPDYWHEGGD